MPRLTIRPLLLAVCVAALLTAACGKKRSAARNTPKTPTRSVASGAAKSGAGRRAGGQPSGQTVAVAKKGTTETGMASWYGEPYHGRRAANGEIYDMNKMTAAHRTLPFDTLVDVLNLDNQQAVQVRITDRGPFVDGRIIDLSRAAAQQISMLGPGTAKVRLKVVGTQSRAEMPSSAPPAPVTPTPQTAPQMAPPPTAVPATPPDPPQGPAPAPPAIAPPQDCPPPALTQAPAAKPAATRSGAGYAVQIGAYTDAKAAGQLQQRMASRYGNAYIENVRSDKGMLYRVRVGPRPTMAEAAQLAASLERENFQSLVVRVDSRAGDF